MDNHTPSFRPELNFIRVLAIIYVLLFHLELNHFKHGYLGVDLFLVLSGFLIGQKIIKDLENKRFSLVSFYANRLKRILPAQFTMILLSLIAGYYILTPTNFIALAEEAFTSALFYSNIHFNNQNGYFDTASVLKPLLHTWSLSIEEQFYVVLPITLLIAFKLLKQQFDYFIYLLILFGFICVIYLEPQNPNDKFFLLQFRAFEFLAGMLTVVLLRKKLITGKLSGFLSILGMLGCVLYPYLIKGVDNQSTLKTIPLIGFAVLVLVTQPYKLLTHVYNFAPIRYIGLSSYSIYLYHWPLIVFYKYYTLSELTQKTQIILFMVSIGAGLISWALIENTFRYTLKESRYKMVPVLLYVFTLHLSIIFASKHIVEHEGLVNRFPIEYVMSEKELTIEKDKYWTGTNPNMAILNGTEKDTLLIMGNSFAIDLIYALRLNGFKNRIISLQTSHKCYNYGSNFVEQKDSTFCSAMLNENINSVNWKTIKRIYLMDHTPTVDTITLKNFIDKLRSLTQASIYIFGPKMTFLKPIPDIVHNCNSASAFAINKSAQEFADVKDRKKTNTSLRNFVEKRLSNQSVMYVDITECLMDSNGFYCIVSEHNNQFLYFDVSHYTRQGATEFGGYLKLKHPALFY